MKKIKLYKILAFIPIIALLVIPVLGLAQLDLEATPPIEDLEDMTNLATDILNWVNTIFWIAAALFILLAGFKYLTAQGDEEKVKTAKNMLIYAVIAIVIALFAGGLDTLVENILRKGATVT